MSNLIEQIKIEFNGLINTMIERGMFEELQALMKLVTDYKNNYIDFCNIIKEHLLNDDVHYKINLFPIIDSIFKSNLGELYIEKLNIYLIDSFKESFDFGAVENKILLFKIFYTWKYLIPPKIYETIKNNNKLDEFKIEVEKLLPGTIAKYNEYRKKFKKVPQNKPPQITNVKKTDLSKVNDNLDKTEPEKVKLKKLLKKKRKTSPLKQEKEIIQNKKPILDNNIANFIGSSMNTSLNNNPIFIDPTKLIFNLNVSTNEVKLFNFLMNNNVKLNKNLPFFSSMAKYYNDTLIGNKYPDSLSQFKSINNNEAEYQNIRMRMKEKLFMETNKNNCAICGFRTLFYNDLIRHLDIHFNYNYLEMEGKNIFRKSGNNKNNWIYGDGEKNSKMKNSEVGDQKKNNGTLENLVFYKNMMNNNFVKISNEKEEDNEELMYPINDESRKICHYCGDDFKKIFSTKYNYWFYSQVVVVLDEKNKVFAHQACFEELAKKIK